MKKKVLKKSVKDRVFFGVCGGLAEHFDLDVWLVRVIFMCVPVLHAVYFGLALCLDNEKEIKK